jgi:preprotein translocase subunit YajC
MQIVRLLVNSLRKRLIGLLLLPLLSLIFIIGWFMYFIGDRNEQTQKQQREIKNLLKNKEKKETTEFGLIEELTEENKVIK